MLFIAVVAVLGVMVALAALFIRWMAIGFDLEHINKQALTSSQSSIAFEQKVQEISKVANELRDQLGNGE